MGEYRPTWFETDEYYECMGNGKNSTLYGVNAGDMTRDELLAMIGWIFKYRHTFSTGYGGGYNRHDYVSTCGGNGVDDE